MKRDMRKYILRKLIELIFTLLFVTLLSFLLMRLSSVDPATAYSATYLRQSVLAYSGLLSIRRF